MQIHFFKGSCQKTVGFRSNMWHKSASMEKIQSFFNQLNYFRLVGYLYRLPINTINTMKIINIINIMNTINTVNSMTI